METQPLLPLLVANGIASPDIRCCSLGTISGDGLDFENNSTEPLGLVLIAVDSLAIMGYSICLRPDKTANDFTRIHRHGASIVRVKQGETEDKAAAKASS